LVVKVDQRCRSGPCAGEVEEFALFRGKLHTSGLGPLAARLPRTFEVAASLLCVLAKSKEIKVVGKTNGYKSAKVLELGI
jgi:hypothetical protein